LIADEAEGFAAEIVHLLTDSAPRLLSHEAMKLCRERYDWSAVAETLIASYAELLGTHHGSRQPPRREMDMEPARRMISPVTEELGADLSTQRCGPDHVDSNIRAARVLRDVGAGARRVPCRSANNAFTAGTQRVSSVEQLGRPVRWSWRVGGSGDRQSSLTAPKGPSSMLG
jgi:hypothetical protein